MSQSRPQSLHYHRTRRYEALLVVCLWFAYGLRAGGVL